MVVLQDFAVSLLEGSQLFFLRRGIARLLHFDSLFMCILLNENIANTMHQQSGYSDSKSLLTNINTRFHLMSAISDSKSLYQYHDIPTFSFDLLASTCLLHRLFQGQARADFDARGGITRERGERTGGLEASAERERWVMGRKIIN